MALSLFEHPPMSIQWYPGHMHKAIKEIKEILPSIDLVIELLDARLPYSSENPVIGSLRGERPCIKLLNKSDLADPAVTDRWIASLESERGVKAMAVCSNQPERIRALPELCKKLVPRKEGAVGDIQALIMGIPNVGKSTLINLLAGRAVAKTGNEPAITKGQQRINLHNGITLIDTPGILWPKVENEKSGYRLATTGAIKETAMSYDDVALFAADFLIEHYPDLLQTRYKLAKTPLAGMELLEIIGRQRGCLASRGSIDYDKAARLFLGELRDGTLGRITLETPEMATREREETAQLMAEIVAEKERKKAERQKKHSGKRLS